MGEHGIRHPLDDAVGAAADLVALAQRVQHPLEPAEHRVRLQALVGDVDVVEPEGTGLTTGRISRSGGASENPPLAVPDHCIGVRIASRSGRARSSPMPISSPYRSTGVPGIVNWRL